MDNYTIIKFLNEGSYGKIYLVEHNYTKDKYALKTINIEGIDRYNKISAPGPRAREGVFLMSYSCPLVL